MVNPTLAVSVESAVDNEAGFGEAGFGEAGFGLSSFVGGRPPRVRIEVTDTGTPAVNSVSVLRTDPQGSVSTVRTTDGLPLQLTASGGGRSGVVHDYEMPYGQYVTYSLKENAESTVTVAVDDDRAWIINVGVPERSMPVEFRTGSFQEEELSVKSGVFYPMGRRNAVVVTDGQRKAPTGSFTVALESLAQVAALRSLVDDAGVLLVNVSPALNLGIDWQYIAVQDIKLRRPSDIGMDPRRDAVMPYVVVDSPVGGSQAQWTWADVVNTYATWADLIAAHSTWASVLSPTS